MLCETTQLPVAVLLMLLNEGQKVVLQNITMMCNLFTLALTTKI